VDFEQKFGHDNMQRIKEFCLMDDTFMSKCFEDNIECTELVLHIILDRNDLAVESVHAQHQICSLQGRSIVLDIYAVDSAGKRYNIEVQRSYDGAVPKRARYNSSLIDANITNAGDRYENLAETYVIFITESDVLGGNEPIYHIDRIIRETGKYFGDESHIIYVNGKNRDETPLGLLMHDFTCKNPEDMKYSKLAERTKFLKESEKGVASMCRIMEDLRRETAEKTKIEMARKIILSGEMSEDKVKKMFGLSDDDLKTDEDKAS